MKNMNALLRFFHRLFKELPLLVLVALLAGSALSLFQVSAAWAAIPIYVRPDGNDTNCDGTTNDSYPDPDTDGHCAVQTIQKGIDLVDSGGTVLVYPGSYSETASNRILFNGTGPYQFGLFIGQAKNGITIQGVDNSGTAITSFNNTLATVNTNATNNFGPSGIFVEGDNVTIAGLRVGTNSAGQNKTLEIIGDNFTLKNSDIADLQGSVYLNDWRFDTNNDTSHIQGYRFEGNNFQDGVSLALASGTGFSGSVSGRVITSNHFANSNYWPSISFTGSGTGVPWFEHSVGGAIIQANTFNNTAADGQIIRARGDYDNTQFDWASYWNDNSFNKAVMVGLNPPANVRTYSYTSGSYIFNNVRRIGAVIQPEIEHGVSGDTVLVEAGTYNESPNINKSLILQSVGGRDVTTIQLQFGPTYVGSLTIAGPDVTVDGFTITGFDAVGNGLASSNIFLTTTSSNVVITNNRVKVGQIGSGSNGDDGLGLVTSYSETSDVASLTVTNNIFEPVNTAGTRAFYINPGVKNFTFRQNQINGNFTGRSLTQAKNGLVEENIVTGTGSAGNRSAGLGTWGYPDPTVYGHTLFRNNVITGVNRAIAIFETNNVAVEHNILSGNGNGVWIGTATPLIFDPATITIQENSITGHDAEGVLQTSTGQVKVERNWWNSPTGPANAGNPGGTGDSTGGDTDFDPWLCDGTDTSASIGFQPTLILSSGGRCTGSIKIVKQTEPAGAMGFTFAGGLGSFNLDDDGSKTVNSLAPGIYTVTEVAVADWDLTQVTCTGGSSTSLLNGVRITLAPGNDVVCTFFNQKSVDIGPNAIYLPLVFQ